MKQAGSRVEIENPKFSYDLKFSNPNTSNLSMWSFKPQGLVNLGLKGVLQHKCKLS